MYLHKVAITNYQIHANTTVDLHPITVLVGPNGAGKSAFLDALLNFSMLSRGRISQAFAVAGPHSFKARVFRGAPGAEPRISFDIEMSPEKESKRRLRYEISYGKDKDNADLPPHYRIHNERLSWVGQDGGVIFDRYAASTDKAVKKIQDLLDDDEAFLGGVRSADFRGQAEGLAQEVVECAREISKFTKFRLEPYVLRQPSPLPDLTQQTAPHLDYSGENLAGTLYYLKETENPALLAIERRAQSALHGFLGLEFNVAGTNRIGLSVRFNDERGVVAAPGLSDGQLLTLGLITLLRSPSRPPILMLEEPENGLTPTVQRAFYEAVRQLAFEEEKAQRSQVILSSHSPFIVCDAWNGEDRNFIVQVTIRAGRALARPFKTAIEEEAIPLQKDPDGSGRLGLKNAEDLISGRYV